MIDAHFHCWQLSRADYGWLDPQRNPALKPICRDVSVSDWQVQSAPHGVVGGVLVQAAATEAETHFLLTQADAHAAVMGVVGWVDLLAPDAPARIARLARHPKLKGLRPMLQDLPDPEWLLNPALAPGWQAMLDADLVFDALVKPVHLPHVLTLAARYPHLAIVIDHAAKPTIATGQWQPWADNMARLANDTQAMCKLSGLMTEAGPDPQPSALRPYAAHVLKCFGPLRVLWGSDWPVLELAGSYRQWFDEAQQLLLGLDAPSQAAVMGASARRLYRL
jgi:L-fuconolactonase